MHYYCQIKLYFGLNRKIASTCLPQASFERPTVPTLLVNLPISCNIEKSAKDRYPDFPCNSLLTCFHTTVGCLSVFQNFYNLVKLFEMKKMERKKGNR